MKPKKKKALDNDPRTMPPEKWSKRDPCINHDLPRPCPECLKLRETKRKLLEYMSATLKDSGSPAPDGYSYTKPGAVIMYVIAVASTDAGGEFMHFEFSDPAAHAMSADCEDSWLENDWLRSHPELWRTRRLIQEPPAKPAKGKK